MLSWLDYENDWNKRAIMFLDKHPGPARSTDNMFTIRNLFC